MSFDNLIIWLKNPGLMDRESLLQLRALLDEYPCFGVARILYLKNLIALNDLRFSKELILTAISVPDRKRLYYFIEGKPMPESVYSQEKELFSGEGFSIIDRFLHLTEEKHTPLYGMSAEKIVEKQDTDIIPKIENAQESGPVSTSQKKSNFSLNYATYLDQLSPITENIDSSMLGQDLINAFLNESSIAENQTLKLQNRNSDNQNSNDREEIGASDEIALIEDLPEETFTETLAKIYLKQKRYDRALEIFKNLNLKYPEKNVYFADYIRFLEKLITNIKNN
jgi:hypothetical protein